MINKFDTFFKTLLIEANLPSANPDEEDIAIGDESQNGTPEEAPQEGENPDDLANMEGLDDVEGGGDEVPVFPEELELAKLAVRALYFNVDTKDVHQFSIKVGDQQIPFEKISDFFEETKNYKPVLGFVEYVMDKFEGISSKWTEQPEIRGDGILTKLKKLGKDVPPEEKLDDGKVVYWTRIILNCLLDGEPNENLVISDVNEENLHEVFNLLKQHFGRNTRGMTAGLGMRAPGVF